MSYSPKPPYQPSDYKVGDPIRIFSQQGNRHYVVLGEVTAISPTGQLTVAKPNSNGERVRFTARGDLVGQSRDVWSRNRCWLESPSVAQELEVQIQLELARVRRYNKIREQLEEMTRLNQKEKYADLFDATEKLLEMLKGEGK